MKNIVVLGSTGSVGMNVLDVVRRHPDKYRICAISANSNIKSLSAQIKEFSPEKAAISSENLLPELKKEINGSCDILAGNTGIEELAIHEDADIIFFAISGTAALKPLIGALNAGKTVALASKEPIVSAGAIISKLLDEGRGKIIPVDSEHSAIMQCMKGRSIDDVRTLYITGSGGALKDKDIKDMMDVPLPEVLSHPTWDMGQKITVDSATLMNKGLEIIEARWLFGIQPDKIKIVIHPESIIHSMVEFLDGTVQATLFCPDMRFPILKALAHPEIVSSELPRVDFAHIGKFTFTSPDTIKFPAVDLAYDSMERGGTYPAVLNAANETAVGLFLAGEIRFGMIIKVVEEVISKHNPGSALSLDDIIDAENWAREEVLKLC